MIDITQLTALISAFRVETEKESISPETVGKILQDIADLLATVPSENDFNILRFWKETLQQYAREAVGIYKPPNITWWPWAILAALIILIKAKIWINNKK